MPHYFRNLCKKLKHYNFVILNDFSNVITKSLNQLFLLLFFYHTEKGVGVSVGHAQKVKVSQLGKASKTAST